MWGWGIISFQFTNNTCGDGALSPFNSQRLHVGMGHYLLSIHKEHIMGWDIISFQFIKNTCGAGTLPPFNSQRTHVGMGHYLLSIHKHYVCGWDIISCNVPAPTIPLVCKPGLIAYSESRASALTNSAKESDPLVRSWQAGWIVTFLPSSMAPDNPVWQPAILTRPERNMTISQL